MESIIQEVRYFLYLVAFYPGSRQFWPYVLLYIAIAFYIIRRSMINRQEPVNFSALLGRLFPAAIYAHASFRMDMKFFLVYFAVVRVGVISLIISATAYISGVVVSHIQPLLQPIADHSVTDSSGPDLADRLWFTLISVVVLDFGYFLAHFLSHRVPALWAFHQVHHGAEHLTPITASRFHPVDYLWTIFVSTLLSSFVVSVFTLYHGTQVQLITVLNVSVAFMLFHLLSNFRHSHVWISFGPRVSRFLVSPCMHQIHHSTAPRHLDKNFGLIFSVWDRWFNSAYIPEKHESFDMGLGSDRLTSHQSVWRHLWLPLCDSIRSIRRKRWWVG
ncbi:MAG: sterol desaturase family protein [Granulosicoccus sp.]